MIIETLVQTFTSAICVLISTCGVLSLPIDLIKTLQAITCYGAFVVGSDILLIFCGIVSFWLLAKIPLGLFIFIWKLLPLT